MLRHFFREHPRLGAIDKAFVADTVFGVVRRKRLLDALVAEPTPRRLLLAYLGRVAGSSARELAAAASPKDLEWIAEVKARRPGALSLAIQAELPDWLVESLQRQMPDDEVLALGRALQQPAPLDLRVNTVRGDRAAVVNDLSASGLQCELTPYSPVGIRVQGRPAINRHPLFLDGTMEVQDEGSQLLAYLVAPRRHDLVVDFCARRREGGIWALSNRAGASSLRCVVAPARTSQPRLKAPAATAAGNDRQRYDSASALAGKIDRPCGLTLQRFGTLRRNPISVAQTPQFVVDSRARVGHPARGGSLSNRLDAVYVTCSCAARKP